MEAPVMTKYEPLTTHLRSLPPQNAHYPMTFNEIERILGERLPNSAYRHRAWWSNNPSNSVMTAAWLKAGFESSAVDMEGRKLIFRRARSTAGGGGGPAPSRPRTPEDGQALVVAGLPAATMAGLAARARAAGLTPGEIAADILNTHAALTMAERLAMADRLREDGPVLDHFDVPAMIREDRERA
jgi:hypothetical protein